MARRNALIVSLICFTITIADAQNQPTQGQRSTRPPENNDRTLRPLTPEEIPPNLNFYAVDPLYDPDAILGWAEERIEEQLDRGMLAVAVVEGKVYLGWRLLKNDPENIAFNVYRSTASGRAVKLNDEPLRTTTDFVDANPRLDRENAWWVKPVVNGREQEASVRAELPAFVL